jgi:hypothetical protein
MPGIGQLPRVDAQFGFRVSGQGIMCTQLLGDLPGQFRAEPLGLIQPRQFGQLRFRSFGQFSPFQCQHRAFGVSLTAHRDELPHSHRQRPREQPSQACREDDRS